MTIVRVALDVPLSTLFDYAVADGIAVAIGRRVLVPFGRRQMVGVVMELPSTRMCLLSASSRCRSVLHDARRCRAGLLDLLRFAATIITIRSGRPCCPHCRTRLRSDEPVIGRDAVIAYRLTASRRGLDWSRLRKFSQTQSGAAAHPANAGRAACNLAQLKSLSATRRSTAQSVDRRGMG